MNKSKIYDNRIKAQAFNGEKWENVIIKFRTGWLREDGKQFLIDRNFKKAVCYHSSGATITLLNE